MGVITYVDDSATIGGTEYSLPADSTTLTAQTDDVEVQAFIDFSAMLAGDQYQIKVYETVNAGGQKVVFDSTITGVQSALVITPALKLGTGWNITVKKLAGTDRAIAWSIRRDTADVNVLTVTPGAIGAGGGTSPFNATAW